MFKRLLNNKASLNGLQHIQQTLNNQHELLRVVKLHVTDELVDHCLHITADNNSVVLFTDSPVWASKLLYLRLPIIDALSKHVGKPVRSLTIKVLPKHQPKPTPLPKRPSSTTIQNLTSANTFRSTEKLGASLSKLIDALKKSKLSN